MFSIAKHKICSCPSCVKLISDHVCSEGKFSLTFIQLWRDFLAMFGDIFCIVWIDLIISPMVLNISMVDIINHKLIPFLWDFVSNVTPQAYKWN